MSDFYAALCNLKLCQEHRAIAAAQMMGVFGRGSVERSERAVSQSDGAAAGGGGAASAHILSLSNSLPVAPYTTYYTMARHS